MVVATLAVCVAALTAFLMYREFYYTKYISMLDKRYFDERQMLLDRLMARDFSQYKQAEAAEYASKAVNNVNINEHIFDDYDISEVGQ